MGVKDIQKTSPLTHIKRKMGLGKSMNARLAEIKEEFNTRTAGVRDFWELEDFLKLLDLAEYGYLGKSRAIIYAFKVGYIVGWDAPKNRIDKHFSKEVH